MIDRTKEFANKIVIKVTDGEMSYANDTEPYFHEEWMDFIRECAKVLPDSEFTISYLDGSRITKRGWSDHIGWTNFSCDKDYQIPWEHSFFKKPCMFKPNY